MREVFHLIRQKYINLIDGNITIDGSGVSIVNRTSTNQTFPFIRIFSYQSEEADQNKTNFATELVTRLEVVTKFDGDSGGEYQCNLIVDGILNLIRTRVNIDLTSAGFNVYLTNIDRIRYSEETEDGKTYFRALIDVSNKVEKI